MVWETPTNGFEVPLKTAPMNYTFVVVFIVSTITKTRMDDGEKQITY